VAAAVITPARDSPVHLPHTTVWIGTVCLFGQHLTGSIRKDDDPLLFQAFQNLAAPAEKDRVVFPVLPVAQLQRSEYRFGDSGYLPAAIIQQRIGHPLPATQKKASVNAYESVGGISVQKRRPSLQCII
jgi:hypothetical protein